MINLSVSFYNSIENYFYLVVKRADGTYLEKMFGGQVIESIGQDSDFSLNRQNGNLQLSNPTTAGDVISAGSSDTKGNIVLFVEEIQADWAQAARKLRKKHITNLAENWKANTNSPLTVEQISKQIAKFVPGDWGFKKELTPNQQKEYDDIITMLSKKKDKRQLLRDQIYKLQDFRDKLIRFIDYEVEQRIGPRDAQKKEYDFTCCGIWRPCFKKSRS